MDLILVIAGIWLAVGILLGLVIGSALGKNSDFGGLDAAMLYAALWPITGPMFWAFNRAHKHARKEAP